jgi:2-keto-4-pentenoate hydratase/2-oxohepta-3-ene-1,7-dioic acid hydratase in catechol pathway
MRALLRVAPPWRSVVAAASATGGALRRTSSPAAAVLHRRASTASPASAGGAASPSPASEPAPASALIRFRDDSGDEFFGVFSDVLETHAHVVAVDEATGAATRAGGPPMRIETLLPPIDPLAIFCVGLNYRAHAAEVGKELPQYPVVFSKTVNALTGHNSAILLPRVARDEVDYEGELAVVIGREARDVPAERALDYVLGYTIANDVTARRWQGKKGGGQWLRAKSFDSFLPLGPFLVPAAQVPDPQGLRIRTWVNDACVQDGHTSDMVHTVAQLIAFLSQDTTLLPGTLILTGTPAGVGYTRGVYLKSGDVVRVEIDKLGVLRNTVAEG